MGLALVAGHAGRTVVDMSDLSLTAVPTELGPWSCIEEEMPEEKNTDEARWLGRIYRHEDGAKIQVTLQATSSRLGALRNWSVAMMGNGWNVGEPVTRGPMPVDGLPFDMTVSLQWLHRPGRRVLTSTWFVSPNAQAVEFERAQLLGWRDKLLGTCIWGEMYLRTLEGDSEEQLREAIEDLTMRLGPHFYEVLADGRKQ
jgi:hypothetical protein